MTSRTRVIIAAVSSAVVLLAVVGIILAFGLIPVPEYPSLAENPDPSIPGTVAYSTFEERDGEFGRECVYVVPAGGGDARLLSCGQEFGFALAWTADGLLATESFEFGPAIVVLDPQTGQEVDRIDFTGGFNGEPPDEEIFSLVHIDRSRRPDGARVETGREHGPGSSITVRLPDGTTHELISVTEAPPSYAFFESQWSPDGQFVLTADSEGRLIVIRAEGAPEPRVLADRHEGHGAAAWYIPGNPTYTVELPKD
ncbi:MAG: TolB family protein [Acidimicrobiia bacterium]